MHRCTMRASPGTNVIHEYVVNLSVQDSRLCSPVIYLSYVTV